MFTRLDDLLNGFSWTLSAPSKSTKRNHDSLEVTKCVPTHANRVAVPVDPLTALFLSVRMDCVKLFSIHFWMWGPMLPISLKVHLCEDVRTIIILPSNELLKQSLLCPCEWLWHVVTAFMSALCVLVCNPGSGIIAVLVVASQIFTQSILLSKYAGYRFYLPLSSWETPNCRSLRRH